MRYVLAYLSANLEILNKLGFNSIDDLQIEKNFKNLPAVLDTKAFGEIISAKTFSSAFRLESAPYDRTLDVIQEQFEIELSFKEFKHKLKEEAPDFTSYYKVETIAASAVAKNHNEVKTPLQVEAVPKSNGPRNWFQQNKRALLFSSTVVIIVAVVLASHRTEQESPKPMNDDFDKKQVEAVLALYKKLNSYSLDIKFVLLHRYQMTTVWGKDSADNFYESEVKQVPFLTMQEVISDDIIHMKGIGPYFKFQTLDHITSPGQIIDSFGNGLYLLETPVVIDTTLSNRLIFGDLVFSSNEIVDDEIIDFYNSPFLPDSIKFWISAFGNHESTPRTLDKIISERSAEIIVVGQQGSMPMNFDKSTILYEWHALTKPFVRININHLFLVLHQLNRSILDYLKSKGISPS